MRQALTFGVKSRNQCLSHSDTNTNCLPLVYVIVVYWYDLNVVLVVVVVHWECTNTRLVIEEQAIVHITEISEPTNQYFYTFCFFLSLSHSLHLFQNACTFSNIIEKRKEKPKKKRKKFLIFLIWINNSEYINFSFLHLHFIYYIYIVTFKQKMHQNILVTVGLISFSYQQNSITRMMMMMMKKYTQMLVFVNVEK